MADLNMIKPIGVQNLINKFCCTIGMLPTSYKESLTYEEQILAIGHYLETVVYPAINNNAEALTELQGLFVELKNYVDNYFDNLDVQEEINNKIDEMAESGDLQEIITQYLQVAGVLCYNTINDLKNATNLQEGSFARTFGKITYNDGNGALYKIRTITSSDVVDENNIISVNFSNTLIGEKQKNTIIENITEEIENITEEIEIIKNKKIIILGDSYANRENSWANRLKTALDLSNNECEIRAVSGTGIYATVDNVNFSTMVVDNISINPVEVTDIIACGGYNDQFTTEENLNAAFQNFINVCKTNYPNAKIHIGFIGWCRPEIGTGPEYATYIGNLNNTKQLYIKNCSKYNNVKYLNNVEYSLHDINSIDNSYFHPNEQGQELLAQFIKQAFETGSCNYNSSQRNISNSFVKESYIDSINASFYSSISNNISKLFTNGEIFIDFDETTTFTMDNNSMVKIGSLIDGTVQGRNVVITTTTVNALINTKNNGYFTLPIVVYIDHGDIYLRLKLLNRNGNGWISDQLKYISIYGFKIECNSMLQY